MQFLNTAPILGQAAQSNLSIGPSFKVSRPILFVEAKEVGKKLPGYDEQLGDYFAKSTDVKLGILTNGVQWAVFHRCCPRECDG